jgi:GT2 family glycosyltransferase
MPLFSIITIVYNGDALLPGTVESVLNQGFESYEHLIIDGASKDNTLNLIREYAQKNPRIKWISEPDKGLYDAMNKGQAMAQGTYLLFLNCGDHLHSPDTLQKLADSIEPDTDVLYGETLLVDDNRNPAGTMSEWSTRKLPEQLDWKKYLGGMLVVHQSFLPRRTLVEPYVEQNLCADFDWCIRILKKSRKNTLAPIIISDYLMGGMSKQRHRQSLIDRFKVMTWHFGWLQTIWAHLVIVLRSVKHKLLRPKDKRY